MNYSKSRFCFRFTFQLFARVATEISESMEQHEEPKVENVSLLSRESEKTSEEAANDIAVEDPGGCGC